MRKFSINVNGNSYEVEVEEVGGAQTFVAPVAPVAQAPVAAPAATAAPVAAPKPAASSAGAVKISAPMPGTILDIKVSVGDSVKNGQVLCILEAMKMENEIMAPGDGTVASINIGKGDSVNTGDLLLSLN